MGLTTFFTGTMMGLSLIVAIGAQNAFVLRQGLKGQHVFLVCLTCAASDSVLIMVGVTSFGRIATWLPWIAPVMRYAGAAFLIWYGARSLISAFSADEALMASAAEGQSGLRAALLTCLALTWLNPHVYLDTVVLLGTIATNYGDDKYIFAAGAVSGSFLFFFALGYGATWLRPLFARPSSWRALEGAIAFVMWGIGLKLIVGR